MRMNNTQNGLMKEYSVTTIPWNEKKLNELVEVIEKLKIEKEKIEIRNVVITQKNIKLITRSEEAQKTIKKLQQSLKSKISSQNLIFDQREKFSGDLRNARDTINLQISEIKHLKFQLNEKEVGTKKAELEMLKLVKENQDLRNQRDTIRAQKIKIEYSNKNKKKLSFDDTPIVVRSKKKQKKTNKRDEEFNKLEIKLQKKVNEIIQQKNDIFECRTIIKEYKEKVQLLQSEITQLRGFVEEMTKENMEIESKSKTILENYQNDHKNLLRKLMEKEKELSLTKKDNNELVKIEGEERNDENLQKELHKCRTILVLLKKKHVRLRGTHMNLEKENEQLKEKINRMLSYKSKEGNDNFKKIIKSLEEEISEKDISLIDAMSNKMKYKENEKKYKKRIGILEGYILEEEEKVFGSLDFLGDFERNKYIEKMINRRNKLKKKRIREQDKILQERNSYLEEIDRLKLEIKKWKNMMRKENTFFNRDLSLEFEKCSDKENGKKRKRSNNEDEDDLGMPEKKKIKRE